MRVLRMTFVIFFVSCVSAVQAPPPATNAVVRDPADIRAHWMKAGEPAPFDGVLLSEAAYSGLRERIARCPK